MSGSLPRKAEEFIPHAGPMCVLDDLISVKDGVAEATATIRESSPFVRRDGTLEESIFVEMIAQAIAAGSGFELTEEQRKSQEGYLLGIKSMKIMGTARVGDTLKIKAFKYAQYGDFGVIEGTVLRGEQILAHGEIKVIQILEEKKPA